MNKKRKHYMLTRKTVEYIEKYRNENDCTSSEAIDRIVYEHKNRSMQDLMFENFSDTMAEKIYERFNKDLIRIRLGANAADKNTQILIEAINEMLIAEEYTKYLPTDEETSPVISGAEKHVTKRIASYKQRKDSKNT